LPPQFLIELPADEPERARRFWQGLLETTLADRRPEQGRGWQGEHAGIMLGLHERGAGPGDRFSLPYFPVADVPAAVEPVQAPPPRRTLGDLPRLRRNALRARWHRVGVIAVTRVPPEEGCPSSGRSSSALTLAALTPLSERSPKLGRQLAEAREPLLPQLSLVHRRLHGTAWLGVVSTVVEAAPARE
jgi:hypothetical protein